MITFEQAIDALDAPEVAELKTDTLDKTDVLNLVLQRSEIIRDQPDFNSYIKAWTKGQNAPILDLIDKIGHDELIRRAAAFIFLEYKQLVPVLENNPPKNIADIGCGYAFFDLFLAKDFNTKLTLIDLETNDNRHFGFKDEGAAYSSLAHAKAFLVDNGVSTRSVKTYNPEIDNLSKIKNLDYAFSFISCGYHYPWNTYADFFRKVLSNNGRVILDIRARRLGDAARELSQIGYVRALQKAANNSADRIMIVQSI